MEINDEKQLSLPGILNHEPVRKMFQEVLDCINDGVFITDGEGNILMINKASLRLCRYEKEELVGRNMKELVAENMFDDAVSIEAIEKKDTVSVMQKGLSQEENILVTATPLFRDGEISMVILTERDVTELKRLQTSLEKLSERYEQEIDYYRSYNSPKEKMVTESPVMKKTEKIMRRIAATDTTVLIQGESGTGKSLMARNICRQSPRRDEPFVEINCGAIPESLFESELFGYEKGAFSGASEKGKAGMFELADKGTIFLDEIGELSIHMQSKILRVIQEREIMRIGGTKYIPVDIRIIAATNKDLVQAVKEGTFRRDLFFRLNVFMVSIPPLRERKEDIIPLFNCFLERMNEKYHMKKKFSSSALDVFMKYSWPGNIRELENLVERMVIVSDSDLLGRSDVESFFSYADIQIIEYDGKEKINLKRETERFEKKLILSKAEKCKSVTELSDVLGVDKSTVSRKLNKYGIKL
ncbi:MAG TPA: sigma 54-interacting transcriptional regulator [Candidatus Copromorpha excrementigallinarum]|uniref:Sigma 54-interacting transcriptional regulator n=1 Tax=Candidatus Allocopromorpha excrementigallinarum TaxID=2840742 RepID=A0A9D1L6T2_9FIRM|nr:sigma 54-interacting transcriptional regulator [Candidatus Copromorpha excrementigallinarum]